MPEFVLSILAVIRVYFRSRSYTALEALALRQEVPVLKRKRPRPTLNSLDRLFWTTLRRFWSRWTGVLVIVKPETVIGRRRVRDYVSYFREDSLHDSLGNDKPNRRPVEKQPCPEATVISSPRLGGLHRRHSWQRAA